MLHIYCGQNISRPCRICILHHDPDARNPSHNPSLQLFTEWPEWPGFAGNTVPVSPLLSPYPCSHHHPYSPLPMAPYHLGNWFIVNPQLTYLYAPEALYGVPGVDTVQVLIFFWWCSPLGIHAITWHSMTCHRPYHLSHYPPSPTPTSPHTPGKFGGFNQLYDFSTWPGKKSPIAQSVN